MRPLKNANLRKWAVLLATPTIWFAHLMIVYAIVSLEVTLRGFAGLPSTLLVVAVTLVALLAIAWIARSLWHGTLPRWSAPQQDLVDLWRSSGLLVAALSAAGVLWQGLPPVIIPGDPASHEGDPTVGYDQQPFPLD